MMAIFISNFRGGETATDTRSIVIGTSRISRRARSNNIANFDLATTHMLFFDDQLSDHSQIFAVMCRYLAVRGVIKRNVTVNSQN